MDGRQFDALTRTLATGVARRRLLGALIGAVGTAAAPARALAARCRDDGRACRSHENCCSGYCRSQRGRKKCGPCESGIVCGAICCPADALNGCTSINGPNGPIVGCLCPDGTFYDATANACVPCQEPGGDCLRSDTCCGDCCEGVCCAAGKVCCYGMCQNDCQICPDDDYTDEGFAYCSGEPLCVDLVYDRFNCGSCDVVCPGGQGGVPCTGGECKCANDGEACKKDEHCCLGHCVGGVCQPCNVPGSACNDDLDCCGSFHSGRCIDGECRCCQYDPETALTACNGRLTLDDVICCDHPQGYETCWNPQTNDCFQYCFAFGNPDGCPSGYEVQTTHSPNFNACTTGW